MSEPFKEPLVPAFPEAAVPRAGLRELQSDKSKVVRENTFGFGSGRTLLEMKAELAKRLAMCKVAKDYFYHLRDDYGVAVPNIDYAYGRSAGKNLVIYTIVDRITGVHFEETRPLPTDLIPQVDLALAQLFKSFVDDYKAERPMWSDFRADQFVYGHKAGETSDRLYIVDVEPALFYPAEAVVKVGNFQLLRTIDDWLWKVIYNLRVLASLFDPAAEFPQTWAVAEELRQIYNQRNPKNPIPEFSI